MASLIAVSVRMMMRGAAFKPGFEAPKIEKIYDCISESTAANGGGCCYRKYNDEQEIDVGNVVKLEPQVFGNK